jgi:hypothetical protein
LACGNPTKPAPSASWKRRNATNARNGRNKRTQTNGDIWIRLVVIPPQLALDGRLMGVLRMAGEG